MDSLALTDPVITDKQALEEFVEALTDLTPGIERDVRQVANGKLKALSAGAEIIRRELGA